MRSLGKPRKQQPITGSAIRKDGKSLIFDKHSPLKHQVDQMLQKDYSNWKADRYRFNAINSEIAKNRQLVTQYLYAIYDDYQINDPLQDTYYRDNPVTFKLPQKFSTPTKNFPVSNQTNQNVLPHLISTKSPFKTPTKQNKRGLDLVNPKQSQFSVSIPKQKPQQYVYLTPQKIPNTQRSKIKFAQKTAASLHSSNLFSNSMNQGFSQSQINKNVKPYEYYEESPYQSRLSIAARLADRSANKSQHTIFEDTRPSQLGLNSRQDLYQQKTYPYLSEKNNIQITFGSEQSLQKNNPQRQYELKKFQDKLYAQKVFQNLQQFNKVGFNPQNGSIKQSFRYCVGCQQPILQANIKIHQTQCLQFKKILNMTSIQEIAKQIDLKIQKIIKGINQKSQQVHQNDPQKIVSSSRVLISEVQDLKKIKEDKIINPLSSQSFNSQYDKVMGIGKNWGLLTQEVNKLKWFLNVKNNFTKLQTSKS